MPDLFEKVILIAVTSALLAGALFVINNRLLTYYDSRPAMKFRRRVLQVVAVLFIILLAILVLPLTDELRGDLLSLFGLVISATIALSSTTLVGNMMAGIMLKTVGNCKPGDHITVGEHFGCISEMDLLHTEIQTEESDLTTLPNLFLVTNPVRVMNPAGTFLTVNLSLGYDVSRQDVEKLLIEAARDTGLENPYVQIRELGDFSVAYSISGKLTKLEKVLSKRRELRTRTMDTLHNAGIEIVSPSFMNTRAYSNEEVFVSTVDAPIETELETSPDELVFEKAARAGSVTKLREKLQEQEDRLKRCDEAIADANKEESKEAATRERDAVEHRIERLKSLIEAKETKISEE